MMVEVPLRDEVDRQLAELRATISGVDTRVAAVEARLSDRPPPPPPPLPPQPYRWLSGAGVADPYAFGAWRGRPVEVWETWGPQTTWPDMIALPTVHQYFVGGMAPPFDKRFPGRLSFSTPIWAKGEPPSKTGGGGNDDNLRKLFGGLKSLGFGNAFLRLAWEHQGDWFYWHVTDGTTADWVKAFRQAYKIAKEISPDFQVVWNPNKSSNYGYDVRRSYPGGDACDIIGVDWYNIWPATHDAAQWDARFMQVDSHGAPIGIGAWLAFSRAQGKPFALPEHGLDAGPGFNSPNGSGDDPHYFDGIYEVCSDPANRVVYESVFNLRGDNFQLYPTTRFPKAAARYRELFGRRPA